LDDLTRSARAKTGLSQQDGLSACQEVRRMFSNKARLKQPIITCYPLLRGVLSGALGGGSTFVDMLSISGVDIVYPGGCGG
jgi:hypothetical protein